MLALPLNVFELSNELIEEGSPSKVIVLSNSLYIALSDLRTNLPVSNIPSLTGVLYDYGMGYLERNPLTLRKSYSEPFTSKAQVMGYNLQNATQQLKSSISFVDLVDAFKEATNTPFKTLVPDAKSRGE